MKIVTAVLGAISYVGFCACAGLAVGEMHLSIPSTLALMLPLIGGIHYVFHAVFELI